MSKPAKYDPQKFRSPVSELANLVTEEWLERSRGLAARAAGIRKAGRHVQVMAALNVFKSTADEREQIEVTSSNVYLGARVVVRRGAMANRNCSGTIVGLIRRSDPNTFGQKSMA